MAKTTCVMVRITPEERALLERVAAADELKVSTWIRRAALQEARGLDRGTPTSANQKAKVRRAAERVAP